MKRAAISILCAGAALLASPAAAKTILPYGEAFFDFEDAAVGDPYLSLQPPHYGGMFFSPDAATVVDLGGNNALLMPDGAGPLHSRRLDVFAGGNADRGVVVDLAKITAGLLTFSFDIFLSPDSQFLRDGDPQNVPTGVWTTITYGGSAQTYPAPYFAYGNVPYSFRGTGDAYIDNVHFIEALASAPEPAVWAAMILGFGMAGTAIRRRRRAMAGA